VPLIVPLTLLKHHLSRYPVTECLHWQLYLNPRTKGLALRFHLLGCHAAL
jgi:uncharacterized protein YbgA (DUF1722 family)